MMELAVQYGPLLVALALAGAAAGLAAGLFGIGGGAIIVPVLYFLFDAMGYGETAMHVAVSTSLATIILTSARSVSAHNSHGAVDWSIIRGWAPWIMLGALAGMSLTGFLSKRALLGIFGSLAFVLSAQLFFGRPTWRLADDMPKGPLRSVLGMAVGALSALMGIGGGTFGVSLMTLYGRPIHQAVATAAGWGVAIGLPSALGRYLHRLGTGRAAAILARPCEPGGLCADLAVYRHHGPRWRVSGAQAGCRAPPPDVRHPAGRRGRAHVVEGAGLLSRSDAEKGAGDPLDGPVAAHEADEIGQHGP